MSNKQTLLIIGGALASVPVWEDHKRGRNWMAKIQPNAYAPGGWDRDFAQYARGEDLTYIVSDIFPNDVLEFAADYTTSLGKLRRKRAYALVESIGVDYLTVELFESALEAWQSRIVLHSPAPIAVNLVDCTIAQIERMSEAERLSVLSAFCCGCGRKQPDAGPLCSCNNED